MRILVPPEHLEQVASEFHKASQSTEQLVSQLIQSINFLEMRWSGTTQSSFYAMFQDAHQHMRKASENMYSTHQELHGIAQRFRHTDEEQTPTSSKATSQNSKVLPNNSHPVSPFEARYGMKPPENSPLANSYLSGIPEGMKDDWKDILADGQELKDHPLKALSEEVMSAFNPATATVDIAESVLNKDNLKTVQDFLSANGNQKAHELGVGTGRMIPYILIALLTKRIGGRFFRRGFSVASDNKEEQAVNNTIQNMENEEIDGSTGATQGTGDEQWYNPDGSINYPPNGGAVPGTEKTISLESGITLGRYGTISPKSDYVTEPGASSEQLSLPPTTDSSIYTEYRVIKPIPNTVESNVAAWGRDPGGGVQYKLPMPIQTLIREGYIVPIKK